MNNMLLRGIFNFVKVWPGMFLPCRTWLGELKNSATLQADVVAGVTVAMVLVPQSMAYAQLAGLPAHYGLYASFLPPIVAALLGSSRQLQTGPVAVVSLLTAAALEPIASANPEGYIAYAVMLAFMVGIFQILLGLFKLGVLVDFLSHPVVTGFTNAGALIIATSQLSKLFGVNVENAEHYYETMWRVLVAITETTHWPTVSMAVISIFIMWLLGRHYPKMPNVLIAVAFTTILSYVIGFGDKGGSIVGEIPAGMPSFTIPSFDISVFGHLVSTAIVIALIGFTEAISVAKAMTAQTRQRLDANQELFGQGWGNIISGFSQSYPVSGSFSRSAVNIDNGAITGFSSVVTGLVVGLTLLFLTPLLYYLPQATLATIIIMAVIRLIRFAPIKAAWKVQPHDAIVAIVTFVLTLVMAPHLDKGILIGVLLSLGLFTWRSMRPHMAILSRHADDTLRDAEVHILQTCAHISILRFDGSLYFANAGYFENKVLERIAVKHDLKFIIIDAEGINEIDASGKEMLQGLISRLNQQGIELILARAKKPLIDMFLRTRLVKHLGGRTLFRTRTKALKYAWQKVIDHDICAKNCPAECPLNFANAPVELQKQSEATQ